MHFYATNVVALVMLNAVLSYLQWNQQSQREHRPKVTSTDVQADSVSLADTRYALFKKKFLLVYLLVFSADWLQVRYSQNV